MRHLVLNEGGPPQVVALSHDQAEALAASELATVTRSVSSEEWLVAAGAKVGAASIGDLEVVVFPKVAIDRLIFMMGYATRPSFWRDHSVHLDSEVDLVEALAHAFTRLALKATEQGLLQGYRSVDESLAVVRGRIRVRDQVSRRFGLGLPVEVTYDDFTTDIAENQILLAAASRLLRLPSVTADLRSSLLRLRRSLADVTAVPKGVAPPPWAPSRLNTRYQPALELAEVILRGDAFENRIGDLQVSGFVVSMWRVFEEFVTTALAEALTEEPGLAALQARMHLDEDSRVDLRPDFLWTGADGRQIVVDAKYKAEKPAGFPQADLYQLLAYCTVLRATEGHLVYAKGYEAVASHRVVESPITIHCHTLDLEATPAALLDQIHSLARRLLDVPAAGRRGVVQA